MATKPPEEPTLYQRLAAPFDKTFSRDVGGQSFTYVTKEQVYSRANEVLGFTWGYDVQHATVHAEADEAVVRVRAYVIDPTTGTPMHREGFGSAKIKRKRVDGSVMDLGNDFKAATSDAVKNALASFGIGLYLYEKDGDAPRPAARSSAPAPSDGSGLSCDDCGDALIPINFKAKGDQPASTWSVDRLAEYCRKKYDGAVYCKNHAFRRDGSSSSSSRQSSSSSSGDLPF